VKTIGFHASKNTIRFVVLEGNRAQPIVVAHDRRPLQLLPDRPQYIQNARNLFSNVIATWAPDCLAYVLTMNATSQDQLAGLVLPFGALNWCAGESGKPCYEFIAQNFSKTFFTKHSIQWPGDKYKASDTVVGVHPPNWTDSERLAALAAWGSM
jgi:hypothetical protein